MTSKQEVRTYVFDLLLEKQRFVDEIGPKQGTRKEIDKLSVTPT